ncbi:MAG: isoprenylcysteine carboxylmethyltransferase family protein, partial [Acidobacteria bacterium]|nr:isoprenylcysteine carboxylmethyltransferase family protein [Acidobacteriota bacterium]
MRLRAVAGLFLQTALAFTLMFLAWGLDDWRGFFAEPARAGLVVVAVLGLAATLALHLDVQPFRKGKRPVGRQRYLLPALILVGLSLIAFLPYADRRAILTFAATAWPRWLGVGLYAAGNVLAFAAVKTLGKQFSGYVTLQDGHRLVTSGIYGVIRHPIYLRALMVVIGLPLVFRSWLFIPFFVLG